MKIYFSVFPNGSSGCTNFVELLDNGCIKTNQFRTVELEPKFDTFPGSNGSGREIFAVEDDNNPLSLTISLRFDSERRHWTIKVTIGGYYNSVRNLTTVSEQSAIKNILDWYDKHKPG